jgi:hypothetical protein
MMYLCRLAIVQDVAARPRQQQTQRIGLLRSSLDVDSSNSFSCLALLKANAHSEVRSTARPPIIVPGLTPFQVEIAGHAVSLDSIRNAYARALFKCKEIQAERLLLDMDLPTFRPCDNMSDERQRRGILADPDEGIDERIRASLFSRVLGDPVLRRRFLVTGEDGQIVFNRANAQLYLRDYEEYLANLLLVVHIGSGMPARATEITTLTTLNGPTSLRGLYYSHGHLFTMSCYNKTRALKGLNTPVARFLDLEATKLLLSVILSFDRL